MTLDRARVIRTLRYLIADLDYDLHKDLKSDEWTGEDHYPEIADKFIEHYSRVRHHAQECNWENSEDCEYRETHNYCPHPEHLCDCY